ncbi:MAG: hypothetical protein OXL37_12430 [Chloroflexota bacterium]|nr:hypothetical protein [Chloroflexota bacterium]MDE2962265.1 hypothetical protein [Chloroflexota bacterium]
MNALTKKPKQLTLALAVLAIGALVAVVLAAGGAPAQATTTATLATDTAGANPLPQQTEPEGEGCSDNPDAVVDSGHIALFDVYWNPEELELTNNPCPPTVEHVPARTPVPPSPGNPGQDGAPARDDRSPSSINIMAEPPTIIHIPNSAKVDLTAPGTPYTKEKYEDLWFVDNQENRDIDNDGMPDGVGDGMVWALPACPPDGDAGPNDLCLMFSAALLDDADWDRIVYHVDHVHQVDIDKQDPRYVLVYDVPDANTSIPYRALWNSFDARLATVSVAPGEYRRPMWFFTSRGTYEFQVHIEGLPKNDDGEGSVTSDVKDYIIHVGAEANLGASASVEPALEPGDTTLDPGDDVTITVTASNAGPDDAPETKVKVTLPEGLTYSTHNAAMGTYDPATGMWTINNLAAGASKTLTITATVDEGTHGKKLTVKAMISATEPVQITETVDGEATLKTYPVPVLDPNAGNDMAMGMITVASEANVAPMFQIMRTVPENSAPGTNVGDPIGVKEPNTGDTLVFDMMGTGADNFTVTSVAGGAQIAVASGADLDYEAQTSYDLVLKVSDGLDHEGNADTAIDHTIAVQIKIEDVDDFFTVTLHASETTARVGTNITFTVSIENSPVPISQLSHRWSENDYPDGENANHSSESGMGDPGSRDVTSHSAGQREYQMVFWHLDNNQLLYEVETNVVRVTWTNN